MDSQTLKQKVDTALSAECVAVRPKMAARNHIFFGIAQLVNPDGVMDARMRLMREFSFTQKIVNASHSGNLGVARQARDTIIAGRAGYGAGVDPTALDAVFLPAIALLALKEHDYDEALSCLRGSLDKLVAHRRVGLGDAGIGYIDQRLNCVRVLAMMDDQAELEQEVVAFIKIIATDRCDALGVLTLRGHASDATAILDQFVDYAIAKASQKLDRAGLARVLTAIGQQDSYLDDALPLAAAATIAARLLMDDVDALLFDEKGGLELAPLSVLRTIEREMTPALVC